MTVITLHNITCRYARQPAPAVRNISLMAQPGEMLALLGPSGSGKSTILKLIAGIEQPNEGDIRIDDGSILRIPAHRRGAVLMFQKAYLFPFLTVADNIGFGLKVKGTDRRTIKAEVARMLELVGLPNIERKYPAQLSGGEQQRVALARALVTEPRVLMLDEPLSSLDTAVRLNLQEAIRRIQRELAITTLLVTHDLSEAVVMSDRTALLMEGSLIAFAHPDQLFQRPPNHAAARFVGVSTFLEGRVERGALHSDIGVLRLPDANGPPRQAVFAIRPENIQLHVADVPNSVAGVVEEAIYRGESTEYRVRVRGHELRARQYLTVPQYQQGDTVFVAFPAEHLFELEDSL